MAVKHNWNTVGKSCASSSRQYRRLPRLFHQLNSQFISTFTCNRFFVVVVENFKIELMWFIRTSSFYVLGDFAILLAAGFTVKKAIVVNLLSSLTAFVGLYIGISVGEDFRIWIIAAGAGMFLYISMVTMVSGSSGIRFLLSPQWKRLYIVSKYHKSRVLVPLGFDRYTRYPEGSVVW